MPVLVAAGLVPALVTPAVAGVAARPTREEVVASVAGGGTAPARPGAVAAGTPAPPPALRPLVASLQEAPGVCPRASGADADAGWAAYREGDMAAARVRFEAAIARCPDDAYATTGLGYVALRAGEDARARNLFLAAADRDPDGVDALVGLGLVAWRAEELEEVRERFLEVAARVPGHPTAIEYLARLPEGIGRPPERPRLVLPERLRFDARAAGERFEVPGPDGWRPFYVKGINLGAALPGRHPSEFPDSATYAEWIRRMAEMNANAVRVYTIHPPRFYRALLDWNERHPDRALRLIHGVWTELPPDDDYRAEAFESGFFEEAHRVVDVVHGRADVGPRPGHASGFYTADVSPWTLAYILGREWEPFSVLAFDSLQGGGSGFRGRYLTLEGGNAMDAWLARAVEEVVAYESETYRTQRPVAYTNWPTLDPLHHPTETTVDEEVAIRRARGEEPAVRPREYDNDGIGLDATLPRPTAELPAGLFASFHAYPYYPDFVLHAGAGDPPERGDAPGRGAGAAGAPDRSRYLAYLEALQAHHRGMPVLVSEYGVPASLGTGHLQPDGWHHGGLDEIRAAEANRRMTLDLAEAGTAGGAIFAWIDEWFKKNWVTIDFELPPDRSRLWYNRLDAEQHYGVLAMEPRPPLAGRTLDERLPAWRERRALVDSGGLTLRAAHDAAYLWLLVETPGRTPEDTLNVGFDVVDPAAGDFRWPGGWGPRLDVGLEVALRDDGREVRLLADPASNPFRLVPVGEGARDLEGRSYPVADPPPGLFRARVEQRHNLPYRTGPNDDGRYDSMRVIVNRRRFSRDSTEYLAVGYDRGILPGGVPPGGFWERAAEGSVLEVRVPWGLLGVTDPSSRTVLQGPGDANARAAGAVREADGRWRLPRGRTEWPDSLVGPLGTTRVEEIGLVVGLRGGGGEERTWPASGAARFSWPEWEEPEWRVRARPTYQVMARTFAALDPYAVERVAEGAPPALLPDSAAPGATPAPRVAAAPPPDALAPARPPEEASDPAGAAWRAGDAASARTLYEARLEVDPLDGTALHRVALARAWGEEYGASLELFDRLLEVEPANLDARVDRARVRAWAGEIDRALAELDALLAERPGHAGALEARALFEAWAGRYDASLATYDDLLAIAPDNTEARRRQAQVLSWASRYERSRAVYDSILALDPSDVDARLGLARTLMFEDELDAAEAEYERLLAADPENVRALRGLGRAQSWDGRLVDGERTLRRAVALDREGVASLVGLAQNLRWQGRNAAALEALERARALDPTDADVREQLRWVETAMAPRVHPRVVVEDDSDGNTMVTSSTSARWHPLPRLGVRADVYRRTASQGALDRESFGVTVTGSWQFEPGWTVSAGAGGSASDADRRDSFASWNAAVASPGRHRVRGTLAATSSALDATALLVERGVRMRHVELVGGWTATPRWRVDGSVGHATFEGSEDNERVNGSLSVSRRVGQIWTFGLGGRAFGFDENLNDGYFDPDFYGIGEITTRWLYEPGRWSWLVEAAPGFQQVTSGGPVSNTVRASARVAYALAPGREVSASFGFASTGLQSFSTGDSEYRYKAIVFGGSWVF